MGLGSRGVDRGADALLVGLYLAVVGVVLVAVFCRYVLNRSLAWSDELVRYAFVWFTLLGGAVAVRERANIRVELLVGRLPPRARRVLEALVLAGVCLFLAACVGLGVAWVVTTRGAVTPALQWPLNLLFYASLPCASALALFYALRRFARGEFAESELAEDGEENAESGGGLWES